MHLLDSIKKAISKIEASLKQHYWHGEPPQQWQDFFDDPNNTELSPYWTPGVKNATHVNQEAPKNTTLKWYGIDNEKTFKNQKEINATFKFTEDNVNYTFNSCGYRGDEPVCDADVNILVCGDSHSFGVGLDDKQVWTSRLKTMCQKEDKTVNVINLSTPGASNDHITRVLVCALQTIRPDFVLAQYTYPDRREVVWDNGILWQLNAMIPDYVQQQAIDKFQSWFGTINDHDNAYNTSKNHMLLKSVCEAMQIDLHTWHAWHLHRYNRYLFDLMSKRDLARVRKHFGLSTHALMAQKVITRIKKYSKHGNKYRDL